MGALLEVSGLNAYYGKSHILQGVDFHVDEGEIVSLLGGNASGKSTTMKTILRLVKPRSGEIRFAGRSVLGDTTADVVRAGIASVPEARRVFPHAETHLLPGVGHMPQIEAPDEFADLLDGWIGE